MEFFFLLLLVIMLVVFGYAQFQRNVIKTPGRINFNEEEEIKLR